MPAFVKNTSKRGGAGRGGGQRQKIPRGSEPETSSMRNGIHSLDRELFALAGIDWSDVPDLPTEQRAHSASKPHWDNNNSNKRAITFEDDEPDHFLASISEPEGIRLTMPFILAQSIKCTPNQAAAADKATGPGCLPLFVYGSKLFPEVLCQHLGLPTSEAMRLANNYVPAILPYCTRYCLAGPVPLAAVLSNHDLQLNSYLQNPRKDSYTRGALVFGLHQNYKQLLDVYYGASFKDDLSQSTFGAWKRVTVAVRISLVTWKTPGWVMADTYVWNASVARLHCFQQDLKWTPQLFIAYCEKQKREAAAQGVEYKGPPLWTEEDALKWKRRRAVEIEDDDRREMEEHKKKLRKWGVTCDQQLFDLLRGGEMKSAPKPDVINLVGETEHEKDKSQTKEVPKGPDAPIKTHTLDDNSQTKEAPKDYVAPTKIYTHNDKYQTKEAPKGHAAPVKTQTHKDDVEKGGDQKGTAKQTATVKTSRPNDKQQLNSSSK